MEKLLKKESKEGKFEAIADEIDLRTD